MPTYWGDSWGTGSGGGGTAEEVADAVWDELLAGHAIAGSFGKAIADILGKTNTLGSGTVTFVSPVSADGEEMYLVSGDDYKVADGRQLSFTIAAGWPNIVGGTVFLNINDGEIVVAGVITASGVGTQAFYFELTAAQTATLDASAGSRNYSFDCRCLTAAGNKFTPVRGTAYVTDTEAS